MHISTIDIHDENIVVAIGIGDIGDLFAVRRPGRAAIIVRVVRKLFGCQAGKW